MFSPFFPAPSTGPLVIHSELEGAVVATVHEEQHLVERNLEPMLFRPVVEDAVSFVVNVLERFCKRIPGVHVFVLNEPVFACEDAFASF